MRCLHKSILVYAKTCVLIPVLRNKTNMRTFLNHTFLGQGMKLSNGGQILHVPVPGFSPWCIISLSHQSHLP